MLLLDEPLGALDAKLRKTLQIELKALQQEVGITFLYVTHDQEEALTMSDRLAVMNGGTGRAGRHPRDVYEDPETLFVADFLGVSNLMEARIVSTSTSACQVAVDGYELETRGTDLDVTGEAKIVIRPERVEPRGARRGVRAEPNPGDGRARRLRRLRGPSDRARGHRRVPCRPSSRTRATGLPYEQGTSVQLHLPPDALRVLPSGIGDEPSLKGEEAGRGRETERTAAAT